MKKRIFSLLLAIVMLLGLLPTTVWSAEGEITQVELTFDAPAIGDTLDFTLDVPASANYEVTSVKWLKDWSEYGNMLCDVYHRVEPGEPYTVRIYINPKEGYSFADPEDITVTVNGSADGVTFTHDDLDTGLVCSVAFDKLGYNVSFDANGGTGTMETVTNVYPDYLLPDCGFTAPAEGMVFNGWTVGSPSGKWYAAGSTMDVNADITLYAKWADPTGTHKITFVNRAYDPSPTVEIIVSEGMYALPQIESIFEIPSGSTFDEWGVFIEGRWQYFAPNDEISVTEDLEIITIWKPIEYEHISKAVFELKLNHGVEYKHGMLAGSLSVSLGEVTGTFNEGAPQPISLATGGYGHGYWIVSGDMLQGTDSLSTKGGYRLYVKFDIPDDRHVLFHPDGFSLSGDLGNITAWNVVSLDGALVAVFKLPDVPGTPLTAEAVTFTLDGYAIDRTIPAVTVGISTPNVSLWSSGYGIDNAYMIYEDYVDADKKVTDPRAKFEKHQDYCLQIDYVLDEGYSFPDSFWDGSYLKKDKFKLAGFEDAVVTAVTRTSVSFRLPQLGTTAVESLEIILNGYEAGKIAWDVSLTAPECMDLPYLDVPTYPPYGRLYCYYDPDHGFGDDDGDFSSIDPDTELNIGDQYPFMIKFYPVDGYDYTELKKENITLITPYGNCTATRFRPGTIENSYWLTFDLPAIGAIATTPIASVNISGLAKPVVGEMPNNSITVTGTGVTVDIDGSYWGRFVSPSFSPVYDDDTAVDSVVFREGETYMFQLYLNAAAGYEFTAASKFYLASELLPAPDMTDLSKSFAMVNPSDSTQAVIYINMNDIAHVHVPGAWDRNETHHWHKCTASGCDAGAEVSRLPDYAEHIFVNGLCTCGAHKHSWSADWSVNETHHWHECSANGCTVTDNSGKDGYAAHDFTAGACVCGVENVITSIVISGITAPVTGETPINSASVDKVGVEVDEENTFWVRYDVSTGRTSDTYADGTSVHDTPFRDREIYLLQITIKPKTGYSLTADTKLLYGGTALSAPDAANPTASCGAIAPDCSMAMALINPTGASAPLTYTVTVTGGTASPAGPYTVDTEVIVTADHPDPEGKKFKEWQIEGLSTTTSESRSVFFYMPANNVTITAIYEDANIIIESASATITEPVVGANPDFNIVSADESKYTVTVVKWNLLDGSSYPVLTADDKFVRGESYQLDVKFVANPGYEFSDSCVYNVNGVSRAAYSLIKGERRCYFDVYEIIDTINVKGVVAPVAGATPDVSGITSDTDGINVMEVKWRDKDGYAFEGDPFVAGEKYILWLKYETESDYKVADDAEVTFNISDSNILDKKITHPIIKMTYEVPADTTYTVSFDANSGTGTMTPVTGISGEYDLPACTFTAPSGKQFKAWSVNGVEKAVGAKITVTANTTVKAVWEDIPVTYYTVTFDSNGGSAVAAQTVAAGQKAAKPADPVKNGYIFKGWTFYGSAYNFNAAVNRNITLVAVWEEDNSFMDGWYWALIMPYSQKFDITATASEGGEIDPAGVTKVQYSKNITYTITPDAGYAIKAVFVDGKDVGAVSEYTFKNVTKKHTIHALFEQIDPYTDVKAGDWFYDDVLYVTAMGLLEGTGNGKFSPEITTDRAMLVTVLWRLEGCPVVDSPVDFFDVADGLWYSDAIDWASANGIVNGYGDGKFGPTDQITREQIAAILNRYAVYKGWTDGIELPMLAQYKCSEWAENNVIWTENNGLLEGLGVDVSDMTAKASRAELAAYLHKFMMNIAK